MYNFVDETLGCNLWLTMCLDYISIYIRETHKCIDIFLKCTAVIFNLINKLKGYDENSL